MMNKSWLDVSTLGNKLRDYMIRLKRNSVRPRVLSGASPNTKKPVGVYLAVLDLVRRAFNLIFFNLR